MSNYTRKLKTLENYRRKKKKIKQNDRPETKKKKKIKRIKSNDKMKNNSRFVFFFLCVCVFKTDTENISIFQDTENWENRKAIASTQVSSPF